MIHIPTVSGARIQSDLAELAEFHDPNQTGWTRTVFSPEYVRSREWVAATMRDAGLEVTCDSAGNIVGRLSGPPGPALVTGSHTDTVPGGGRFDGPLGVLCGIEAARCIRDSGHAARHELRVVDFLGEEPNEFGVSCVGSRAIAGTLTADHLTSRDPSGRTLADAIDSAGGSSKRIGDCAWGAGDVEAFVELHIEQGPVLDQAGIPIGVVTGIAGIERVLATFDGRAGHAGTTPMDSRRDALCAAAEMVLAVERVAAEGGGVGTSGRIEVLPGASNVIPGHAQVWSELRSIEGAWLDERSRRLNEAVLESGRRRGVSTNIRRLSRTEPVAASKEVVSAMVAAVGKLGLQFLSLSSGAGHDAVQMAHLGRVGMLFVPSAGGRSHSPDEWTAPEHVEAGAAALLATLLVIDAR